MNLTNNELIYDQEDTPKDFAFADWNYLVPVLKAVSAKITSVEQRGIYNDEPRRFALTVSEALTEQEVTDVLAAWTAFDATSAKAEEKALAVEELRIQQGIKVKAYLGYLCEVNNVSAENKMNMLGDVNLTVIDRFLLSGALEGAQLLISDYMPTEHFPIEFVSAIYAKLTEAIATVNAFIAQN
jgi:hypothetical protein